VLGGYLTDCFRVVEIVTGLKEKGVLGLFDLYFGVGRMTSYFAGTKIMTIDKDQKQARDNVEAKTWVQEAKTKKDSRCGLLYLLSTCFIYC